MSSSIRATSTMRMLWASQPRRVFTVTGRSVDWTTRDTTARIRGRSCNRPAPAPRRATFATQQPQLTSMRFGRWAAAMRAACATDDSAAP